MTWSRRWRPWVLLLLLYVAADFADPSIPGVFFFDSGPLFVDGVVQLKSSASVDLPVMQPTPSKSTGEVRDEEGTARPRAAARPASSQRVRWTNLKHDDSASFAATSGPDASPLPLLS